MRPHDLLAIGDVALTWPVCDQAVSALRLHLDVDAAGRVPRQEVRPVGDALSHVLPEAAAVQRAGDQPAAGEGAGRRPGHVAERHHGVTGGGDGEEVVVVVVECFCVC